MVHLQRQQFEEMIRHALAEYPNEACGLLAGKKEGQVEKVYRMTNAEHSPVSYCLDPEEQVRAFMEIEERGWGLLALYHSHIHLPAYPSARDVEMAFYPDSTYVIISLAKVDQPSVRAFRIVDGTINEERLLLE